MELTSPILTLNFYSHPIDVIVHGPQVFINHDHFQDLATNIVVPGGDILDRNSYGTPYINLKYLRNTLCLENSKDYLTHLIRYEFFNYVVKELSVIRELLPAISTPYLAWEAGIVEHRDVAYLLESKAKHFTKSKYLVIPDNLDIRPALISLELPRSVGTLEPVNYMSPEWLIPVAQLPQLIRSNPPHTTVINEEPMNLVSLSWVGEKLGKEL